MAQYIITVRNETSDIVDFSIFQKPADTPSLPDWAWHTVNMPPRQPEVQFEVPFEIAHHEFFASVSDPNDPQTKTAQVQVKPGQTCTVCGDKAEGYTLEVG